MEPPDVARNVPGGVAHVVDLACGLGDVAGPLKRPEIVFDLPDQKNALRGPEFGL